MAPKVVSVHEVPVAIVEDDGLQEALTVCKSLLARLLCSTMSTGSPNTILAELGYQSLTLVVEDNWMSTCSQMPA